MGCPSNGVGLVRRGQRIWIWLVVILLSWGSGWQLAAQQVQQELPASDLSQEQLEQGAYVRYCGTCHVALPASVLPTQAWQQLMLDPNHYGQQISLPTGIPLQLAWQYLRDHSRPLLQQEQLPLRLADSRLFKALHPRVEFPLSIQVDGCIDCHSQALSGNFASFSDPTPPR